MRTLVITTGCNNILLRRWLPLLRNVANYKGEVLILDYGTIKYGSVKDDNNNKIVTELKKDYNVIVLPVVQKLACFYLDRQRASREYLKENNKWNEYDIIMIVDGNDIIFYDSIQPLLDLAKDHLCYVKEHPSNFLKLWDDYFTRPFIQKEFKSIENNPIINGGMVIGKSEYIMELLDFEMDMAKKYADYVCDQLYLCILIYFYNYPHALEVGYEWNYTHAVIGFEGDHHVGPRKAIFKDGKAYAKEDGRPIIIEHRTGTGWWFWQSPAGITILNGTGPISITAEYDTGLDYGAAHFAAERGLQQNREWFYKFKYPACR